MKVLYFIVGLLTGLIVASQTGVEVCNYQLHVFEKENLAATLVGMNEGWERGRLYTERQLGSLLFQCQSENCRILHTCK